MPRFGYNKWFYKWFLNTRIWKKFRLKIYHLQKGLCAICGEPMEINNFHCHHKSYDYLGNEHKCDCIAVHVHCHADEHKRLKARSWPRILVENHLLFWARVWCSILEIKVTITKLFKRFKK